MMKQRGRMDKKVFPKMTWATLAVYFVGILMVAFGSVGGASEVEFLGLIVCAAGVFLTLRTLFRNDEKP